jgi:hypothetical protein
LTSAVRQLPKGSVVIRAAALLSAAHVILEFPERTLQFLNRTDYAVTDCLAIKTNPLAKLFA